MEEPTDSLEELLSSSVLSEGRNNLQGEEQIIWSRYIQEIDSIEDQYGRYLRRIKGHTARYLYPDTPILRLDRFLRILYSGVLLSLLASGLITGKFSFLAMLALFVLLVALRFIGVHINVPNYDIKSILLITFLFVATIYFCACIFDDDKINNANRKEKEDSNCVFSDEINSYCEASISIGSYYRLYKLKKPTYKKEYVDAIRNIEKQLRKEFSTLIENRKEKVCNFKKINPYQLTPKYVSSLSMSDRVFLVTALEQKAKEAQGEESRNNALKAAGAVGLLALLIGTGGTFGP